MIKIQHMGIIVPIAENRQLTVLNNIIKTLLSRMMASMTATESNGNRRSWQRIHGCRR